jgi:hypothetical protein
MAESQRNNLPPFRGRHMNLLAGEAAGGEDRAISWRGQSIPLGEGSAVARGGMPLADLATPEKFLAQRPGAVFTLG